MDICHLTKTCIEQYVWLKKSADIFINEHKLYECIFWQAVCSFDKRLLTRMFTLVYSTNLWDCNFKVKSNAWNSTLFKLLLMLKIVRLISIFHIGSPLETRKHLLHDFPFEYRKIRRTNESTNQTDHLIWLNYTWTYNLKANRFSILLLIIFSMFCIHVQLYEVDLIP